MFIRAHHHSLQPRRHALVTVLALLVLALGLLSVAPEIHLEMHHDAHSMEHSCAIDWFASGVTSALAIVIFGPVALIALGSIRPVMRVARVKTAWELPPGRGPPQG